MAHMSQVDGSLLYSLISQLDQTQAQLLRLLREQKIELDPVQNERFNLTMRELKMEAESLAARVQLLLLQHGIDRRVTVDRRRA
jgi:hypothetical protein